MPGDGLATGIELRLPESARHCREDRSKKIWPFTGSEKYTPPAVEPSNVRGVCGSGTPSTVNCDKLWSELGSKHVAFVPHDSTATKGPPGVIAGGVDVLVRLSPFAVTTHVLPSRKTFVRPYSSWICVS